MAQKIRVEREPTHPGELLQDVSESAGLSLTELASRLGISRQTVSKIINKKSGVSAENALRIGTLFGNGANLWLRMQQTYDLWQAREKIKNELSLIEKVAA